MRIAIAFVLLAACKGKAAEAPPAVAAPKQAAAPVVADAAVRAAKPPPTKEQLAAYREHMKAGWALQKQQKWAESVPEFEGAAAAIELDQRALSELGWSAMNAGDFTKARKSDEQAVRVAIDPKVKASALYNLGLVMAKTGDTDGALRAYQASLALRPNKTVEQELGKLGKPADVDAPDCEAGEDVCACINRDASGGVGGADQPTCELLSDGRLPARWKRYSIDASPWRYEYIVDDRGRIALSVGRNVDRSRYYEDTDLEAAEVLTLAGHQILKLTVHERVTETAPRDDDMLDVDEGNTTAVTLCVLGDASTPARCPLRDVPLSIEHDRYVLGKTDQVHQHPATTVDLQLALDGTATVKLVKGASDSHLDALVGPHKLW